MSGISVTDPKPILSPPNPPCEDKSFAKKPCYDFVWTGVGNQRIQKIVDGIMQNNPGKKIPSHKVKSFKTKGEVDKWLLEIRFDSWLSGSGMQTCKFAHYGIQTSTTQTQLADDKLELHEVPTFDFQIPLQIAAEREIARSLIRDSNFSWYVGLKEYAQPTWEVYQNQATKAKKVSSSEGMGPTFFLAITMFGFVFQIRSLVTQKELKPQQATNIMGLNDTAYWFSWLTWELVTLAGFPYNPKFKSYGIIWS
ncbi:hypothetical protein ACOSQ3_024865 [Xanthoceras sorbifolium]